MKYFTIFYLLTLTINCAAQVVKSKDGVTLGTRSELLSSCSGDQKLMNIDGIEIEITKFCECMCDILIPTINSWEIEKAVNENKLSDLFAEDKNLKILMNCAEGSFKIDEDFDYDYSNTSDFQNKVYLRNCVNEVMSAPGNENIWTQKLAEQYCDCTFNEIVAAGYTYKDMLEIEDENSNIFNELALPCLNNTLKNIDELKSSNTNKITDIKGGGDRSFVPLIDYLGKGYKVKIAISDVSKYYLFDTGASDLIIDRDTERELLLSGVLKRENYLGKGEYTLANNKTVQAQKVSVNNISIGDYTLNNVEIGIIDNGILLCGKSLLDKFSKWEIDNQNNFLILYK